MSKKWAWMKLVLIILALLAVTLLFLELPRLYYKYSDYQLLKEGWTKKYDSANEKSKKDGFKEAEKYFSYVGDRECDFYDSAVTEGIDYELALKLASEMQLLLSPDCEEIIEEFIIESKNALGTTQTLLYGRKQWEVGFLNFDLPKFDLNGTIVYDANTFKIVWLECVYWPETQTQKVETEKDIVAEYYKELVSADICVFQGPGDVIISPFPNNVMRKELLDYIYMNEDIFMEMKERVRM